MVPEIVKVCPKNVKDWSGKRQNWKEEGQNRYEKRQN